jgi:uncharacterized membrane protein YphA (DoxX/SURF4 family)
VPVSPADSAAMHSAGRSSAAGRVGITVGTLLRLVAAAVWLTAGFYKLRDVSASVEAVRAYQLLPGPLVTPAGYALPVVEIGFGVLFLVGLFTRYTAVASAVFDVVYVAGIASAAIRGLRIDCGCFSPGGPLPPGAPTHYAADLIRDTVFAVITAYLIWRPRTWLSADGLLARRRVRR